MNWGGHRRNEGASFPSHHTSHICKCSTDLISRYALRNVSTKPSFTGRDRGVATERDEQRPSRPPHPPLWHLNLKLCSAAGARLFGAAGKRNLPTIRYFSLRIGFKIGSENPNSGATSPSSALGVRWVLCGKKCCL